MKKNLKTKRYKEIQRKIIEILDKEQRSFSIRELTKELEKAGIKKSPQVVLKNLKILKEEGRIVEVNG